MIIYVDIHACKDGNGTKQSPFKHINDAAQVAKPGDEVLVAPGIYREYVNPLNAGLENNPITYRSKVPLGAVITGAEKADKWKHYKDNVWVLRINNNTFGTYNPYTTFIKGDWYFGQFVRHTGAVYLNNRQLYETQTLEECLEGKAYIHSWEPEWSVYKWYTEQNTEHNETIIYANFQGTNPNEADVDINVRRNCFMPSKTGVDYITVSGFSLNKAATTWAPPAAFQDGMIGPHWSKGWIIEDCEISNSKCSGISLGKYYDSENNHYFTTKHVKSATQMERDAVCRGQYHGWTKERIGSHIVRRCHIHHCEQTGIVGRMGCVFSTIEDNHIHHINCMQELAGAEVAGIKMHAAIDVTFRKNHIHHTTMGIWCDWEAQGTRITQNLFHNNNAPSENIPLVPGGMSSCDVFVEVSHGPTLIDHNISLSRVSFKLASQGCAIVHNLCLGPLTSIGSGSDMPLKNGTMAPRYTPYHIRHRTEVAGMMTFLHGDDRIYNNIFIQNWPVKPTETKEDMGFIMQDNQIQGTDVFDDFPTYDEWIIPFELDNPEPNMFTMQDYHFQKLPVWVNGNAYFNGAKSWKHETYKYIDKKQQAYVNLVEENGNYRIETNIYSLLDGWTTSIIDSDVLGEAFEPEQRFENPDGSTIVFNRDFHGNLRSLSALPGPFANAVTEINL
ncbi:right-handed parallel beta-helix repeat-containing protein [uncultured Robinsoniella sp.]|uniref:right-handed parallel beta-helix repeat-containing protein n=1 Tax=uncultured Robinsoniella sp. TaxID=904190 RepID=UPI00374F7F6F